MFSPQSHLCIVEEVGKLKDTDGEAVVTEDISIAGVEEEVAAIIIGGVEGEASTIACTPGDTTAGAGVTILITRASIRKVARDGSTRGCWRTPGRS